MKSRRLRYRFASRAYAAQRQAAGLSLLPTQISREFVQISLYECCLMAGLSQPRALRHQTGISSQAVKSLAHAQDSVMSRHPYHNKAHIGQVIMAAGLLADKASLPQIDRDLLIIAALIHDFHHLGRLRCHEAFWQETKSFQAAVHQAVRHKMDVRLVSLFHQMIMATSMFYERQNASVKGNDILSLLLDADLFASLFLPKKAVDRLTASLKFEDRLTLPHTTLRDKFISHCQNRGLASLAAQQWHESLPVHQTYFRSDDG